MDLAMKLESWEFLEEVRNSTSSLGGERKSRRERSDQGVGCLDQDGA